MRIDCEQLSWLYLTVPCLDTRYYWNLSQHIFRYNHQNAGNASDDVFNNIHTVDECKFSFLFLNLPILTLLDSDLY